MRYQVVSRTIAAGPVDQAVLDQLRTALDLKRAGRLTDAEDDEFGYRTDIVAGSDVLINLLRLSDERWSLEIRHLGAPPPAEYLQRHRAAFRAAFATAGLVVDPDVQW